MTIERASEDDVDALERIISGEFAYKGFSKEDIFQRVQSPEIAIFKKIIGKELAGFVEVETGPQGALINAITIREKYRMKGHAKELLEYALDYIKVKGYPRVTLLVKSGNGRAKKLYTLAGFGFLGMHDKKIEGADVEVWEKILISRPERDNGYGNVA
ncbi:MAG TPA: GNAT family N-acetyltransferase [Candidatus Diapherotrites archaeon]|uniref:GNAT family N-acetyltransferase n=1 Tax=Candidatus Iainarchaeum sp. TaxID=3101447 RepID=A0A7J4J1U8_9ARCH|nr:GNAT family N-acetyltransferase [Candidatus Diapherotrites archaeon]